MGGGLLLKLLIGLLGLAAVGTYYAPHQVQVETRAAIAVLGLLLLVFYFSSLGFWIVLLSFCIIGALQLQHRGILQYPPRTFAWLNDVLAKRDTQAYSEPPETSTPPETSASAAAPEAQADAEDAPAPPASAAPPVSLGPLQGRLSIAGIAAALGGIIILLTVNMSWYTIGWGGEEVFALNGHELAEALAEDEDSSMPWLFLWALAALGVATVPSVLLPRVVPILVSAAGMLVSAAAFVYILQATEALDAIEEGASVNVPGAFVVGFIFLVILVLHLIPVTARPLGGKGGG